MSHIIQLGHCDFDENGNFSEPTPSSQYFFYQQIKLFLNKNYPTTKTKQYQGNISFYIQLYSIKQRLPSICLQIRLDYQKKIVKTNYVICMGRKPVTCETKQHRLMLLREYSILVDKILPPSFCLNVNFQSGLMLGKSIINTKIDSRFLNYFVDNLNHLKDKLSFIVLTLNCLINQLPQGAENIYLPKNILLKSSDTKHRMRLKKYLNISNDFFNRLIDENYFDNFNHQKNQYSEDQTSILFGNNFDGQQFQNMEDNALKFNHNEIQKLTIYLKVPPILSNNQNRFIYNEIAIRNEQSKPVRTKIYGGMSQIFIQVVEMEYINEDSPQKYQHIKNRITYKKLLAIKCAKQSASLTRFKQKSIHEQKILKILKNIQTNFIMKHYVTKQPSYKFNNHVLTDFYDKDQTLDVFLSKRNRSMSLKSKLFLLISIGQGLRILKKSNIVHMDLSPSNFLIGNNYSVQLFDFGESYHPDVCQQNYRPGYTLPFVSPERFKECNKYECSSDIFVFGILIYYIINMRTPLPNSSNIIKDLKNNSYVRKLLLVLEENSYIGCNQQVNILYALISRCLDPDPAVRPHISWCFIILKELFYFMEQKIIAF